MIINTYFTDGYIDWATLFVESYRFHNGNQDHIILTAVNVPDKEKKKLKNKFSNISIIDRTINMKKYAKKAGVDVQSLKNMKHIMENKRVTPKSKVWKLMVAGDDRIKSIKEIMSSLPKGEHLLHFDADTYITGSAEKLKELVKNNDFTTGFRIQKHLDRFGKIKPHKATLIYIQGFTINEKSHKFIDCWIKHIDKVSPANRPKGYGQSSCFFAYEEISKNIPSFKWGNFLTTIPSYGPNKEIRCWNPGNKGHKKKGLDKYKKHYDTLRNNK